MKKLIPLLDQSGINVESNWINEENLNLYGLGLMEIHWMISKRKKQFSTVLIGG